MIYYEKNEILKIKEKNMKKILNNNLEKIRYQNSRLNNAILFIVVLEAILAIFCLVASAYIMDSVIFYRNGNGKIYFYILVAVTLFSFLIEIPFFTLKKFLTNKVMEITKRELRELVSKRISEISFSEFNSKDVGEYISIYNYNINVFCANRVQGRFKILSFTIKVLLLIVFLFYISWIIGLIALFFIIMNYFTSLIVKKYIPKIKEKMAIQENTYNAHTLDLLEKFYIFFYWNKKKEFQQKMINNNSVLAKKQSKAFLDKNLLSIPFSITVIGLQVILMTIISLLIHYKFIPFGYLSVVLFCSNTLIATASSLFLTITHLHSADKLLEFSLVESKYEKLINIKRITSIEFQKINFIFDSKKLLKKPLSEEFKVPKKYLINGKSGTGKSTLVRTIMKLNDDYEGKVKVNGINIKKIDKENFYNEISFIDRNTSIINETVRENIVFGLPYEEIKFKKVLSIVNLHKSFSQKSISIKDINISQGQKQKILIARALYKAPCFFIIDEGMVNIDQKSKTYIEEYLMNQNDMAVIRITHNKNKMIEEKYEKIITL
ncbi:hypothetical protein C4B24_00205 [Mycoplasma marinum]|uniref:ABC transporter ATP-binding protein n=2 Tax=Mycoplasma marinum TaxID=1937190 RepID=A0A4R0XMT2_9MOLU|nr:hypothetical protein C4B24_00205 [Mycoplasma marinum]